MPDKSREGGACAARIQDTQYGKRAYFFTLPPDRCALNSAHSPATIATQTSEPYDEAHGEGAQCWAKMQRTWITGSTIV